LTLERVTDYLHGVRADDQVRGVTAMRAASALATSLFAVTKHSMEQAAKIGG
jgi:hypothetical protein